MDAETGFYYYGARYLDPKTSRWISADPALGEYVPSAPVDEEAKKRNGNLPGQGGVFNYVNLHVYHYAGNNPVKYVDPDGRENIASINIERGMRQLANSIASRNNITFVQKQWKTKFGEGFSKEACAVTALLNIVSSLYAKQTGRVVTQAEGEIAIQNALDKKFIKTDAKITSLQGVADAMMESLGVNGKLEYIGDQKNNIQSGDFIILVWDKGQYVHFVNAKDGEAGLYNDTYHGYKGEVSDIKLEERRPVRVFRFEPD
jgi:uncharacterized protein RhaS with RHS repeats